MQAKLSDSLKRVLSSSESDSGSDAEEEAKRLRVKIDEAPQPPSVAIPFVEISMSDIELEERIGIGNASTIFKGLWKGKEVAVKQYITYKVRVIQEGVMRSFNYEKKMMMMLAEHPHPNVIACYGACTSEETPALIMDYIPKNAYIKEIEWPLRVKIARQVSAGLHHLHSLPTPITHNDLKTDNLLLTEAGHVCIIVSELKHAEVTVFGNPAWTAPECLNGQPFSPKSDIYAFGIILWELTTREEPLRGMEENEMTKFVTEGGRPTIPSDCPSQYAQLIQRCWAPKPADRPDAGEVADILAHWNSHTPPVSAPEVHVAHSLPSDFVPK